MTVSSENPVDIYKSNTIIHYYNNVASGEKSRLNWYSNPGPLTNRPSDQTTDILIHVPDNIQD